LLAEEVQVIGHSGTADKPMWIGGDEVLALLEKAHADANIGDAEKRELITTALSPWQKALDEIDLKKDQANVREIFLSSPSLAGVVADVDARAAELTEAHRRIRQAVSMKVRGLTVKPQLPPDLLGLLVLQPFVSNS